MVHSPKRRTPGFLTALGLWIFRLLFFLLEPKFGCPRNPAQKKSFNQSFRGVTRNQIFKSELQKWNPLLWNAPRRSEARKTRRLSGPARLLVRRSANASSRIQTLFFGGGSSRTPRKDRGGGGMVSIGVLFCCFARKIEK